MISDLQPISAPGTTAPTNADTNQTDKVIAPACLSLPPIVVPRGTIIHQPSTIDHPITDIPSYLECRKPVMRWEDEERLFCRLPSEQRSHVRGLQSACLLVLKLVKAGLKVSPACKSALATFDVDVHPNTFRAQYDAWIKSRDWLTFVNLSKAGADWQVKCVRVPDEFMSFLAARIGRFKRDDADKQAVRSIHRQWRTGKNLRGEIEAIPGYGFAEDWWKRNHRPVGSLPPGWSYSNLMRQLKARNVLPAASRALMLQGTHAAKEFVPDVLGSTAELRFLEEVQFDDVKTDWRVFDPVSKEPMDLWLLIARDRATRLLLGFGMRPARVREDGSQEHLKLRDMKQLCGWILERFGLPPYVMRWKIERGTATLSEGSVGALNELLGGRIVVSYSSMIGGTSPDGYFERRIGNSKGKASLESHNRTLHITGAHLPGQTGPSYGKRPADLGDREKECVKIAHLADFLPEALRDELGYPLLTLKQARAALHEIFTLQNERDDHSLEGFEEVLEWYCAAEKRWMLGGVAPVGAQLRKRMQTPIERALSLFALWKDGWQHVSPEVVTAFYEHTQRMVKITDAGEIEFTHEGRKLTFVSPQGPSTHLAPSIKLLGYFHPDEPTYLYLTDGKGGIVGVWLQRARVNDKDAVAQAIAYQARAMRSARELAEELCAPERAQRESMHARNEALVDQHGFVDVSECGVRNAACGVVNSEVARGLSGVERQREKTRQRTADDAELARLASEALMESHS